MTDVSSAHPVANGSGSSEELAATAWEGGNAVFECLQQEQFCDLFLVLADEPQQSSSSRVAASKLLLAASSPAWAERLAGLRTSGSGKVAELPLPPGVSAKIARAAVAASCGTLRPYAGLSVAEMKAARMLLKHAGLETHRLMPPPLGSTKAPAHLTKTEKSTTDHKLSDESEDSEDQSRPMGFWLQVVAGTLLLVVALFAYWPTTTFNSLAGGLFMDDVMIQRNDIVVNPEMDWKRLWRTDYWGLEMFDPNTWTHKSFRPFVVLTFRWNYWFHGFDSAGFFLTNVAMHAGASAQIGYFALTALALPPLWSGLLAALFAVHPVHTESICYIVGRADLLCTQVLMLALQLYWPCTQPGKSNGLTGWVRLLLAVLLIVLAGLCKETGFTFFGLLVGWEALCFCRSRTLNSGTLQRSLRVLVLLLVGAAACAARVRYTSGTQIARMDPYSNPIAASEDSYVRILSYSLVHGIYMKLLVWPLFLCYDYSMDAVPLVQSLTDARLLLPMAAYTAFFQLLLLAVTRLRAYRSARTRIAAESACIGAGFFILSFLPMTNILFPIGTLVAERLLYMPSIGFLIAIVCICYFETRKRRTLQGFVGLLLAALLAFWGFLCFERVKDWKSVEEITVVDGLKQLRSTRTQFNIANIHLQHQRLDEALDAYKRANALDPQERDSMPLYHAGQILLYRGEYAEAEKYLHKAVSGFFSPLTLAEEEVWHDYGLALWHVGRGLDAVTNLQNAIITNPGFAKGYNNLGCALFMLAASANPPNMQALQEGLQSLEKAATLSPGVALYWRNLAVCWSMAGDRPQAERAWQQWGLLDPVSVGQVQADGAMPQDCAWEFYFR